DAMDLAKEESMRHPEIYIGKFMQINHHSPQGAFEINEHINFCFTCIGKTLPIEQQMALLLKEIFDYKVREIAQILDATEGVVKHLLVDARKTMHDIFDKRCSLINKTGACHQCSELNGLFNPRQEMQQQHLRLHTEDTHGMDAAQLFEWRTRIARAIDPYESKGADLQFCHMEHVRNVVEGRTLP
ncbi:MAG TPA: sigma-70 region 4 domain-containing protein, partial [Puia sp.]|nr:sigma-70 region 4 domain-containing protein [Puia sp.]